MIDLKNLFSHKRSRNSSHQVRIPYELKHGVWEGYQSHKNVKKPWPICLQFDDTKDDYTVCGVLEIEHLCEEVPLLKTSLKIQLLGVGVKPYSRIFRPSESKKVLKIYSKLPGFDHIKNMLLFNEAYSYENNDDYVAFVIEETTVMRPDSLTTADFDFSGRYYCVYSRNNMSIKGFYVLPGKLAGNLNRIELKLRMIGDAGTYNFK